MDHDHRHYASLLAELSQLKTDHWEFGIELTEWIELECRQHNATDVEKALKPRITEYLEELEQKQHNRMARMLLLSSMNKRMP